MHNHRRPLCIADLDAAELQELGHNPDATEAAHAGHRLALATRDEFVDRCDRIAGDLAASAQVDQDAPRKAWAKSLKD